MAVGKEIRGKIKSVENTRKITKAMEMVAASKMRKAQERMRAARPYAERIGGITANLSKANPEYRSPYMREVTAKTGGNVGFIVVTTDKGGYAWDYIYEPDAPGVIEELLKRYIEALVYQGVAENMASEQAARMVAMKAATDNAGNLIGELKLIYNKTRQAAITKELSEIVSGAAAV